MKTIRAVVGALFALSAIIILTTHQAGARQGDPYTGPIFGDLTIVGDTTPGSTVLLTGDGFAPDSALTLLITSSSTAEVAREGDAAADADGSASVSVDIGTELLGNYTVTLKGQTVDGATIELSGAFLVAPDPEPIPEPTAVPTEAPATDDSAATDEPGAADAEVQGATTTNDAGNADEADVPEDANDEEAAALPGDDDSSGARTALIVVAGLIVLAAGAGLWWRGRQAPTPKHT
jgi:hypothetical protein